MVGFVFLVTVAVRAPAACLHLAVGVARVVVTVPVAPFVTEAQVDDTHRTLRVIGKGRRAVGLWLALVADKDGPAVLGEGQLVGEGTCDRRQWRQGVSGSNSDHPVLVTGYMSQQSVARLDGVLPP